MRYTPLAAELFQENRRRLQALLPPNSLAIFNSNDVMPTNADGTLGFRQNADLYHLTGIDQEETIFLFWPDAPEEKFREVLFVRETSPLIAIWEGERLSQQEAAARSGIKQVKWTSAFEAIFQQAMIDCSQVFLNSNEHKRSSSQVETRNGRFIRDCQRRFPLHRYERVAPLMAQLRAVKQPLEIEALRQACRVTRQGFLRVAKKTKPGINEMEVEAEFAHEFIRNGCQFAYPPIIAAGKNNCVLHYVENSRECRAGDLLLLDVGASYANYNADLTRTIPVSGKFTQRQKDVYRSVLRVLREVGQYMSPGRKLKEVQRFASSLIEEELLRLKLLTPNQVKKQNPEEPALRKYFMHGVGHPLGIDVHDLVPRDATIQEGWVMTCEPAIYIPEEGFGIRLENDFVIQKNGNIDLMGDIPIEPDEIETLMRRK
jgi:Xaa-Pro aminopeptidase